MDFDLTDEQRLLKESVGRLLADRYGFEQRRGYARESDGWSRAIWAEFAGLGLLALPFTEEDGGFNGGAVERMIVAEAFGRALVIEPYFPTVVLCGGLLRHAASPAQRQALVPRIADGSLLLAFAHAERQSRYDLADVAATARRDGDGWVIDGSKTLVLHGDTARMLIVSARVAGAARDRDGIGLFLVPADAPGVSLRGYATQDGQRAAEIELHGVRATEALGEPGKALPAIERVAEEAIAFICAEAVGSMAATHELTLEYLRTRKQFGVPIGSFQALQHRAVDMYVALEQARSMAIFAAMTDSEPDANERARAASAAKVQIGRSARHVGREAVQLHGGIGVTMEYSVGHHFKRLTVLDVLFGDADHHLRRLGAAGGLLAAQREAA